MTKRTGTKTTIGLGATLGIILGFAGVCITLGWGTFAYLSPIKIYLEDIKESIKSVSDNTLLIEERSREIGLIKDDVLILRTKAKVLITEKEGGTVTSADLVATVDVKPGAFPRNFVLQFAQLGTALLPAKLPPGIKPVGYNFALVPYYPDGLLLSPALLALTADISISYKDIAKNYPEIVTSPVLLAWNRENGEWTRIEPTIQGNFLYAQTNLATYFALGYTSSR